MKVSDDIGVILLCRYSSKRLPGKILKEINGKKVISYILERLQKCFDKEKIVIACSSDNTDDKIADFALKNNYQLFRGSLDNVSSRFYQALKKMGWTYGIRINGDNIFTDQQVLSKMVDVTLENGFNFISNVKNRTFPKGMSIEIVRRKYYETHLKNIINSDYHKEHVMSYFYGLEDENHFYYYNEILPEAGAVQLALDTQADLERTKILLDNMTNDHTTYCLEELFTLYKKNSHGKSI